MKDSVLVKEAEMEYLGLLVCKKRNRKYEYLHELESFLKHYCDKVIVSFDDLEGALFHVIEENIDEKCILVITDELIGPFCSADNIFAQMQEKFDIWALDNVVIDGKKTFRKEFFVIEQNFIKNHSKRFMESGKRFFEYCSDLDINVGTYLESSYIDEYTSTCDEWIVSPYDIVVRKKIPFMLLKLFDENNSLKYSLGHETRRVYEYIKEQKFDMNLLWDVILGEYDIRDIKNNLHLEFIVDSQCSEDSLKKHRVAIFVHMYYKELFEECISYLKSFSESVDLYLSTAAENLDVLRELLLKEEIFVKKISCAGKKGRDAGALLVEQREEFMQYEYACFIHDKKSSGGGTTSAEGRTFMELVWDNLVPNVNYVNNVIKLFDHEERLGILAPPIPMMGRYVQSLAGNEWTVCFEETLKVAQKINCPININKGKQPFVLSTCFWCRTKALYPLLEYRWTYDDFMDEPLKIDGTINHAIERILPYVAQTQGYYSGIVSDAEYASVVSNNLMYIVDGIYSILRQQYSFLLGAVFNREKEIKFTIELLDFLKKHETFYVYGAGAQAMYFTERLKVLSVTPQCYLVTDLRGNSESINGIPVKCFGDMYQNIKDDAGIVVAVSNRYVRGIVDVLEVHNLDYLLIDVD